MAYAASIISKFNGIRPLARLLSLPPTTVQGWKDSGRIPAKHQQAVLDMARARNIKLKPSDFFENA